MWDSRFPVMAMRLASVAEGMAAVAQFLRRPDYLEDTSYRLQRARQLAERTAMPEMDALVAVSKDRIAGQWLYFAAQMGALALVFLAVVRGTPEWVTVLLALVPTVNMFAVLSAAKSVRLLETQSSGHSA